MRDEKSLLEKQGQVSLADFYKMLEKHDWYYMMSDDLNIDEKGSKNHLKLLMISEQSKEHGLLFVDYSGYMFTGTPWGTTKLPKPPEPRSEF